MGALPYGEYRSAVGVLMRSANKRRAYNTRSPLRLVFAGTVATLAALTENWLGLLFSLGVIGFAVTFALHQPLLGHRVGVHHGETAGLRRRPRGVPGESEPLAV